MGAGEKEGRDESLYPSAAGRCIGNAGSRERQSERFSVWNQETWRERERKMRRQEIKERNLQDTSLIKRWKQRFKEGEKNKTG